MTFSPSPWRVIPLALLCALGVFFSRDIPTAHAGTIINAPNYLGLHSGLVGFWSFDGKSIAGVHAYDQSGQGNRGMLTNGPVRTIGRLRAGKMDVRVQGCELHAELLADTDV